MNRVLHAAARSLGVLVAMSFPLAATADDLVAKSIITMPEKAGRFTLESAKVDPARPQDGVVARYSYPGSTHASVVTVTVRPFGRVPPTDGTTLAMDSDFDRQKRYRSALEKAVADDVAQMQKGFKDLKYAKPLEFRLPQPPSARLKATDEAGARAEVGAVIQMQVYKDANGAEGLHVAGLAYRDLYWIRTSVFSARGQADVQPMGKLTAEAMKDIVAAVDIRNIGPCGGPQPVDGGDLVTSVSRMSDENCVADESQQELPLPPGKRLTIVRPLAGKD